MIYKIKPAHRKVIIVTGCATGLGLELAHELYEKAQYHVVITARQHSISELKAIFNETDRFIIRSLDVTNDDNIYQLVNEIALLWGRVDCIINNAAICFRGVIEHMDADSELLQLKTNYLGPMSLTRAVLPIMREQGGGQIINISSVSGMMAMPTMASYSASKHAREGATEALWYEARPFGINVSLIELGFLNSDSFKRVLLSKKADISSRLNGPHSEYYRSMTPFIERLMKLTWAKPKYIANRIVNLLERKNPPLRVALTADVFIFSLMKRILPSQLFHSILFWLLPDSLKWGHREKQRFNKRVPVEASARRTHRIDRATGN
ncbi:MAG: SDR family NAD(P)-dependent oxidoreductase [Bdellovibrionota bacterium]